MIDSEVADPSWPASVRTDLKTKVLPRGSASPTESYLDEAARQIGSNTDNDFVFGPLHSALRDRLHKGLTASPPVPGSDILAGQFGTLTTADDLEAPLAVQSAATRSGTFPLNKFNGVQMALRASRAAQGECNNNDAIKRLMLVNNTYVTRIERSGSTVTRVWARSGGVEQPIDVPSAARFSSRSARLKTPASPRTPCQKKSDWPQLDGASALEPHLPHSARCLWLRTGPGVAS